MTGRIDGLPAPEGPQRTRESEKTRRTADQVRTRETQTASDADRVEISETTRLQEVAHQLADIREDRVAQARARIAAGDYNAENVRRIIADRIMEQFGV